MPNSVGTIDCAIYENGTEYYGIARITLPTIAAKTVTVNGYGVAGDVDFPVMGHKSAMSTTIEWLDAPESSRIAIAHGQHVLDCRVARENFDATGGQYVVTSHKYIMTTLPKTETLGSAAPASQQGASNEYSVISFKEYIDGTLVRHVDPLNYIDIDTTGTDQLSAVRTALGK